MENYESKLITLRPNAIPLKTGCIPYSDFAPLISIISAEVYERKLHQLARKLPHETLHWPRFGQYNDYGYKVELGETLYELKYCERGSCELIEKCENIIDLSYQIFKAATPSGTSSTSTIIESLDSIKDQRLIIWLRMSSEIFRMYEINNYFGLRTLNLNVTWMCEELVRMGAFRNTYDAFKSEKHIVQGLMLSGLAKSTASTLYQELQHA